MEFSDGPAVSRFAHITRSALAQRLFELEESSRTAGATRETVSLPFSGSAEHAHRRTKSIRQTMARHGFRLYYKRTPDALLLWAVNDPTIDRTLYISKPRKAEAVRAARQARETEKNTIAG